MKKLTATILALTFTLAASAAVQRVLPSTDYTRTFLRATNSADARGKLGVTNAITYTNSADVAGKIVGNGIGSNTAPFALVVNLGTAAYSNSAAFLRAPTNSAGAADNPTTNGYAGYTTNDFPLAIVGFTNGVAKWEKRPKTYSALLSQSGEDAPIATVLENTIGEVTWARDDVGQYHASIAGGFNPSKTFVLSQANAANSGSIYAVTTDVADLGGGYIVGLYTWDDVFSGREMGTTFIPIRLVVFP